MSRILDKEPRPNPQDPSSGRHGDQVPDSRFRFRTQAPPHLCSLLSAAIVAKRLTLLVNRGPWCG